MKVVFDQRIEKKHSVRFNASAEDAPVRSIYIDRKAIEALGNPSQVEVEIKAFSPKAQPKTK